MFQRIFEYFPNSATVFTGEYLCNCEECLQLHFSSCLKELKEVDMDETEGEENLTVNTELGSENDCHIDEDIDQAVRIFNSQIFFLMSQLLHLVSWSQYTLLK